MRPIHTKERKRTHHEGDTRELLCEKFALGLSMQLVLVGRTLPQNALPGPTLPWWLVIAIMGGVIIYAFIRSRK